MDSNSWPEQHGAKDEDLSGTKKNAGNQATLGVQGLPQMRLGQVRIGRHTESMATTKPLGPYHFHTFSFSVSPISANLHRLHAIKSKAMHHLRCGVGAPRESRGFERVNLFSNSARVGLLFIYDSNDSFLSPPLCEKFKWTINGQFYLQTHNAVVCYNDLFAASSGAHFSVLFSRSPRNFLAPPSNQTCPHNSTANILLDRIAPVRGVLLGDALKLEHRFGTQTNNRIQGTLM